MRDLSDTELAQLQTLLDEWGAAAPRCSPLDVSAVDGYLCGILLQPHAVPEEAWWPFVLDADGQLPAPAMQPSCGLRELLRRRHAVLGEAIAARRWFDPWLFELEEPAPQWARRGVRGPSGVGAGVGSSGGYRRHEHGRGDDDQDASHDSALPWVAGFALAVEKFPALSGLDERALAAPLALLYLHFDADDLEGLEDEPALAAALAAIEPPADLAQTAEDLVRAVLLLADISQPRPAAGPMKPAGRQARGQTAPVRASPTPGPRSKSARPARTRRG